MRKIIFAAATLAALSIGPTGANAQNVIGGAIIGGATGAVIGGAVGGGRGAAVGATVGATTGAVIGANADERHRRTYHHRRRHCWVNQWGHRHCRYY
jgi:uncharacterized protein YcfJ